MQLALIVMNGTYSRDELEGKDALLLSLMYNSHGPTRHVTLTQRRNKVQQASGVLLNDKRVLPSPVRHLWLLRNIYTTKMSSKGKSAVSVTSSSSILDWFKPLRNEAIARLRTNAVGLVGLTVVCNLLPVPSPWRAFDVVWRRRHGSGPYFYLCAFGAQYFSAETGGRRQLLKCRTASFWCACNEHCTSTICSELPSRATPSTSVPGKTYQDNTGVGPQTPVAFAK